jgi:hypothetical protein
MIKDHWETIENRNGYTYYIGWYCADECDIGAHFGGGDRTNNGKITYDADDPWEIAHNLVCDEVAQLKLGALNNRHWEFESLTDAKSVMKLLNSALKSATESYWKDGEPWPEWALKAQTAGWKPPKGWKL